jgi:hypothetical protein
MFDIAFMLRIKMLRKLHNTSNNKKSLNNQNLMAITFKIKYT